MFRCQVLPLHGQTCVGQSTSQELGFRGRSSCTASLPRGISPGRHKHLPGTGRCCSLHAFSGPGRIGKLKTDVENILDDQDLGEK